VDRATVTQELTQVFAKVFRRPVALRDDLTAADVEGWDSMTNIRLLDAVERAFSVSLSVSEVMGLKSVGSLTDLICEKKRGA
jgi:acyl carrier protein